MKQTKLENFRITDQSFILLALLYQQTGGAYIIYASKNGKCIPIRRIIGTDKTGMLYVGETKDFGNRTYTQLKASFDSAYRTDHLFARRYNDHPTMRKAFPPETLWVRVIPSSEGKKVEREILDEAAIQPTEISR